MSKRKRNLVQLPRSIARLFPEVKRCYDADRPIDVEVKVLDIKGSKPLDPTQCAVSKAFQRASEVDGAVIGVTVSYLIKGTTAVRYRTPAPVRQELIEFDRHGVFEEGEYWLAPMPTEKHLGKSKPSGKKQSTTDHSPVRRVHRNKDVRVLASGRQGSRE